MQVDGWNSEWEYVVIILCMPIQRASDITAKEFRECPGIRVLRCSDFDVQLNKSSPNIIRTRQ